MFHEVGIVVKLAEMAMQTRTFLIGTPVQFAELVAISDYQRDLEAIFKCMSWTSLNKEDRPSPKIKHLLPETDVFGW